VFSGQEAIIFHRSQVGYKLTLLIATFYNFFGGFIIVLLFTEWHSIVTTTLLWDNMVNCSVHYFFLWQKCSISFQSNSKI